MECVNNITSGSGVLGMIVRLQADGISNTCCLPDGRRKLPIVIASFATDRKGLSMSRR